MRPIVACLAACVLWAAAGAHASTLNFDSLPNASVVFYGDTDTFTFLPEGSGYDFQISSAANAADADTVGLVGNIEGTFSIGPISTPFPNVQTASVGGTGLFSIRDEDGVSLQSSITWKDVMTVGAGGLLNVSGLMNVTGVTYTGTNADLMHLVTAENGAAVVTFQFVPPKSLTQLTTDGKTYATSYSGSVVPEPATLFLLGSGLTGLGAYRNWKERRRGRR
jgi:hypothetical protein